MYYLYINWPFQKAVHFYREEQKKLWDQQWQKFEQQWNLQLQANNFQTFVLYELQDPLWDSMQHSKNGYNIVSFLQALQNLLDQNIDYLLGYVVICVHQKEFFIQVCKQEKIHPCTYKTGMYISQPLGDLFLQEEKFNPYFYSYKKDYSYQASPLNFVAALEGKDLLDNLLEPMLQGEPEKNTYWNIKSQGKEFFSLQLLLQSKISSKNYVYYSPFRSYSLAGQSQTNIEQQLEQLFNFFPYFWWNLDGLSNEPQIKLSTQYWLAQNGLIEEPFLIIFNYWNQWDPKIQNFFKRWLEIVSEYQKIHCLFFMFDSQQAQTIVMEKVDFPQSPLPSSPVTKDMAHKMIVQMYSSLVHYLVVLGKESYTVLTQLYQKEQLKEIQTHFLEENLLFEKLFLYILTHPLNQNSWIHLKDSNFQFWQKQNYGLYFIQQVWEKFILQGIILFDQVNDLLIINRHQILKAYMDQKKQEHWDQKYHHFIMQKALDYPYLHYGHRQFALEHLDNLSFQMVIQRYLQKASLENDQFMLDQLDQLTQKWKDHSLMSPVFIWYMGSWLTMQSDSEATQKWLDNQDKPADQEHLWEYLNLRFKFFSQKEINIQDWKNLYVFYKQKETVWSTELALLYSWIVNSQEPAMYPLIFYEKKPQMEPVYESFDLLLYFQCHQLSDVEKGFKNFSSKIQNLSEHILYQCMQGRLFFELGEYEQAQESFQQIQQYIDFNQREQFHSLVQFWIQRCQLYDAYRLDLDLAEWPKVNNFIFLDQVQENGLDLFFALEKYYFQSYQGQDNDQDWTELIFYIEKNKEKIPSQWRHSCPGYLYAGKRTLVDYLIFLWMQPHTLYFMKSYLTFFVNRLYDYKKQYSDENNTIWRKQLEEFAKASDPYAFLYYLWYCQVLFQQNQASWAKKYYFRAYHLLHSKKMFSHYNPHNSHNVWFKQLQEIQKKYEIE